MVTLSEEISLRSPGLFHIADGESIHYGGNQTWYPKYFQRLAGCGPTNGANLIRYLAGSREGCAPLAAHDGSTRSGFVAIMEESWRYITPGLKGVNSTSIFAEGLEQFGRDRGVSLYCDVLEIPKTPHDRPGQAQVFDFLKNALAEDLPIAFLNLHNGDVANLDQWHWVTLISVKPDLHAQMIDQGKRSVVDLALWLSTTTLGGGLVTARPAEGSKPPPYADRSV